MRPSLGGQPKDPSPLAPSRASCEELIRALPDLLDGEVSEQRQAALDRHLDECWHCLRTYQVERGVVDVIRARLTAIPIPPDLSDRITALVELASAGDHVEPEW